MPHIKLQPEMPGIIALFDFNPETAKPLCELAEILLRGPSSLSQGERELIAAYVSLKNECTFCHNSHLAAARAGLGAKASLAAEVMKDPERSSVSPKLKALIKIAGKVCESGTAVTSEVIKQARDVGATDREIHDTVLTAAAFCMYNRYVDGLATLSPPAGSSAYDSMGKRLVDEGYRR